MKITVVGAGAMGGSYGGLLALAGHEVSLIDAWQAHVDAINRDGLRIDGVCGDHRVRVAASIGPTGEGAEMASSSTPTTRAPPPRPCARCGPDIRRGALNIVLSGYQVSPTALDTNIHAVFPHSRHLSAKVRALIDFLRQRFGPRPYWEVDDHQACATARLEAVSS